MIRAYAQRLDGQCGEDAYHNAVLNMLVRGTVVGNAKAYLLMSIRHTLYKLYAKEAVYDRWVEAYCTDAPTLQQVTTAAMHQPRAQCKQGHAMAAENLILYHAASGRISRACRTCKTAYSKRRWQQQLQRAAQPTEKEFAYV